MTTKEQILDTAARLFSERGFEAVSVREITGAAGVNLGAITYYFGGKEQLFGAALLRKVQPLRKLAEEIASGPLSPSEKLARLLRESALYVLHRDPGMKALFAEGLHGGEHLPPQMVEQLKQRNQLVASIIQEGIDRGDFRPCDTETAAWIFFGMLTPFVLHRPLIEPRRRLEPYPREEVLHLAEAALKIFFHGLESNPAQRSSQPGPPPAESVSENTSPG